MGVVADEKGENMTEKLFNTLYDACSTALFYIKPMSLMGKNRSAVLLIERLEKAIKEADDFKKQLDGNDASCALAGMDIESIKDTIWELTKF